MAGEKHCNKQNNLSNQVNFKNMKKELQQKLITLFGLDNLEKVCRLKVLNNQMKDGTGCDDDEYQEHEELLEELEDVFPKF